MNKPSMIGQKLLLAFKGKTLSSEMTAGLQKYKPAGITLFRSFNIDGPEQVLGLTRDLQQSAKELGLAPLLIATDQEGGQLMAIGEGTTQLPGNLALGAVGSPELAQQAGEVLGRELSAMGFNMNYAPCCDVNSNPHNPVIGTRSFGEDPAAVASLSAAMIKGIQSQGVAAVAKHFPGHGDTITDSHLGLPSLAHNMERLQSVEFPPFKAAILADVQLMMSAHLSLPSIDGEGGPPATLSSAILQGLLRGQLGFQGVIVSDAMDMHAIAQGERLGDEAIRAANAGVDLLLLTSENADHERVFSTLAHSIEDGQLDPVILAASLERISRLKNWVTNHSQNFGLDVVCCAVHQAVARDIAERSITLIRDEAHLIPLRINPGQKVVVVIPKPMNLTPADTSSYTTPELAAALRKYHPAVEEIFISMSPDTAEIQHTLDSLQNADLIICGTINAFDSPSQTDFIHHVLKRGIPTIIVALRMPYDLIGFPEASTYLCTYSILEPSMDALAKILTGRLIPKGKLPVSISGLFPIGYGINC
jgi:beta-N-acetylhexosaminidase